MLAQGAEAEGLAVWDAVRAGGTFSDYRKAFEALGYSTKGPQEPRLKPPTAAPSVQSTVSRRVNAEQRQRALPLVS